MLYTVLLVWTVTNGVLAIAAFVLDLFVPKYNAYDIRKKMKSIR